ncbi:MAG: hypothetical protein Q7R99_02065 [bacterium]|nr:hypothetical protein [bacterium]
MTKQSIKEFFRPSGGKVILTMVFIFLSWFSFASTKVQVDPFWVYAKPKFLGIFSFPFCGCGPLADVSSLAGFVCLFVAPLVIWYILLCIVMAIIRRVSKALHKK